MDKGIRQDGVWWTQMPLVPFRGLVRELYYSVVEHKSNNPTPFFGMGNSL